MSKIGVSKCLLGYKCRYDGRDKLDEALVRSLEDKEVIPFCPEEVLGIPREPVDIVDGKLVSKSGKDVTKTILNEAKEFILSYPDITLFYLKSKSPSCALCSAKEYNQKKELINSKATGIFAKELKKWYKNAKFYER